MNTLEQAIKGDCKMWKREICHSIGREPKDIKRNNDGVKRSALMGQDPGDTFAGKGIINR